MKNFNGKDYLLSNKTAENIYKNYAAIMPIFDYHCHLSAQEIAQNMTFYDIGEIMLKHDHYKWRLMRIAGIDEHYITGDADFKDKFIMYAKALNLAIGNPLYHWTHMELKFYFGIEDNLTFENAGLIYEKANEKMSDGTLNVWNILKKSNVNYIATTDDPADSLIFHKQISEDSNYDIKVVPTFRPDKIFKIGDKEYLNYINKIEKSSDNKIDSLKSLLNALKIRMDYFEKNGCNSSDHGIEYIPKCDCNFDEADKIFNKSLTGEYVSIDESDKFLAYILIFLAGEYYNRNWVMQLHLSVIRNQNQTGLEKCGPDSGYDSVGNVIDSNRINMFFNKIEQNSGMPKTVVYTLNPASYYVISTAAGNFNSNFPGKVQLGPAWWFCDNRDGIKDQIKVFANTGVLGLFNGMLTDSRSFTSFVRHDYFRRILCSVVGEWIEDGEYPNDDMKIKELIERICFYNAKKYFEGDN